MGVKKLTWFLAILFTFGLSACGSSTPDTVSLPVPFSGSAIGSDMVLIAEGNPVGGSNLSFLQTKNLKTQSQQEPTITWLTFDPNSGANNGTVTFFLDTMEIEESAPIDSGGIRRVYTMRACANFGDNEVCSSNFQCFEYPTDYPPNFSAEEACSGSPDEVEVVRKLACSGNDDITGHLFDGRFLIGMTEPDFRFCTQQESTLVIREVPFIPSGGDPEGRVVFSMIAQGGLVPILENPGQFFFSQLFLPGDSGEQGDLFINNLEVDPTLLPALFTAIFQAEFLLGDSRLVLNNCRALFNQVPELTPIIRQTVAENFTGTPGVTPFLLENGEAYLNSIGETQCEPVNCDPIAGEATGIFQDLCQEFGPSLTASFICFILTAPTVDNFDLFSLSGVWTILRD